MIKSRRWADPWEPFFIVEKAVMPLYDERFKQYGFNRIQQVCGGFTYGVVKKLKTPRESNFGNFCSCHQVCEMHIAGFEFQVLDTPFLLHLGLKEKDEFHSKKQSENDQNRLLFRKFKQELKQKYPLSTDRCY